MLQSSEIRRIYMWGGPGVGKSISAAIVFSELKLNGYSVELISEYIKSWVYDKREPVSFDQLYIYAKQQRAEDCVLRSGVKYIVSDSPLTLQCVYSKRNNLIFWKELLKISQMFNEQFPSFNILLQRDDSTYEEHGRYQNLHEAKEIDKEIVDFMNEFSIPYVISKNRYETIGLIRDKLALKQFQQETK